MITDDEERLELNKISWVSQICFVEKIEPERLCLGPRTLQKTKAGLEALRAMDPLKAYLFCVETLTEDGEITLPDE